jgi:hypothetical protein
MMRRPTILATLAAALVASSLPLTADAATTFTAVSVSAVVDGTSVTATVKVRASEATTVDQYAVCARTSTRANVDFSPKQRGVTISTTGTTLTRTKTFAPGTYSYWPCLYSSGRWTTVGAVKKFTVATSPTPGGPAVLFSDDFTGTGDYDHSKWGEWSAATYNGSAAYGSIKPGDRAKLDGEGHLSVPATPDQGTSISTKDDFTFQYGTVTARMKVPTEAGYWPAFWTLNNNPDGHDTLPLGEADIHESYTGLLPDSYHHGTHTWNNDLTWGAPGDNLYGIDQVIGEWHDYSAKFEPGKITFYLDGVQSGAVTTKAEGGGKPYGFGPDVTRGNWLLLTLAVGGAGGQQDGKAVAPARLLVDQVTVTSL